MIKAKTVAVLAVATGIAIGASAWMERQKSSHTTATQATSALLLPELKARINDVGKVVVTRGGTSITLEQRDGQWTIAERSGYPADKGKLRSLLLGAAELTVIEPKTANATLHTQLGLTDPKQALDATGNGASLVELFDKSGQSIAAVIVGNQRPSKVIGSERSELFVRKPDSDQTYLVEGTLSLPKKVQDLIEKELTNIETSRVQRVTVTYPGGEEVILAKDKSDAPNFTLVKPVSTQPIKSAFEVDNIAHSLARLVADDVKAATVATPQPQPKFTAVLETFDGLRLTLIAEQSGEDTYGKLSAEYVAPPADSSTTTTTTNPETPVTTTVAADTSTPTTADPATLTATPPAPAKPDPDTVRKEVDALNKKFATWAYLIPAYHVSNIGKGSKDLFGSESNDSGAADTMTMPLEGEETTPP